MGNNITITIKETITMVMQIIIMLITTINLIITMNEKEMILIDLTIKTTIKGPINKDKIDKKNISNRIDMTDRRTYNLINKIRKTIKIGYGYKSKYSQKERWKCKTHHQKCPELMKKRNRTCSQNPQTLIVIK